MHRADTRRMIGVPHRVEKEEQKIIVLDKKTAAIAILMIVNS